MGSENFQVANLLGLQRVMEPPSAFGEQEISEKTIWSFWHSGFANLSPLLHLCVGSWQAQNPDWDIRIIERNNVHAYAPPSELPSKWEQFGSPAHQADAARLAVLKIHGAFTQISRLF